jgi:hypothetical protein
VSKLVNEDILNATVHLAAMRAALAQPMNRADRRKPKKGGGFEIVDGPSRGDAL